VTLLVVDHKIEIEHLANGCIYCTEHCAGVVPWTHLLLQCCAEGTEYCKQLCKSSRMACLNDLNQAHACKEVKLQQSVSAFQDAHHALIAKAQSCTKQCTESHTEQCNV